MNIRGETNRGTMTAAAGNRKNGGLLKSGNLCRRFVYRGLPDEDSLRRMLVEVGRRGGGEKGRAPMPRFPRGSLRLACWGALLLAVGSRSEAGVFFEDRAKVGTGGEPTGLRNVI